MPDGLTGAVTDGLVTTQPLSRRRLLTGRLPPGQDHVDARYDTSHSSGACEMPAWALLSVVTVLGIGYAARAGAIEKGKIVEVPASTARAMTPQQKEQAKAYARQNGIRWRIVQGK